MSDEKKPVVIDEKQPGQPVAPATMAVLKAEGSAGMIARPVVTPEVAKQVIAEWEELKKAIGSETDIRREKRKSKQNDGTWKEVEIAYYKKSYWRKAATFLGLSVDVTPGTEKFELIGGVKLASVCYRATGPNGRGVTGDGHCGADEGGKANWSASNLLATAHSRAYNRAVSNYIGGGEVSADELDEETKAPSFEPASAEQVIQVMDLLLTKKIRQGWEADAFKQAKISRWEDMAAPTIVKCIDYLKTLPNAEAA